MQKNTEQNRKLLTSPNVTALTKSSDATRQTSVWIPSDTEWIVVRV